MNIFLCGFEQVGCDVLDYLAGLQQVEQLAVFSHQGLDHVPSLLKQACRLSVWNTDASVNDRDIWPFKPDIIASIYYRNIISKPIIDQMGGKVFNLHPSLLPSYRGCSSITWAILNGESSTGITYHYVDEGIDTGPIILQARLNIAKDEKQGSLYRRAMSLGAEFFPEALDWVKEGRQGVEQQGPSSYYSRGAPYNGEINPDWDEVQVERMIRAMTSPPLPYARYKGKEVRSMEEYRHQLESQ